MRTSCRRDQGRDATGWTAQKRRDYNREYREAHKRRERAYHKAYHKDNEDKIRKYQKAYRASHKDYFETYRKTHEESLKKSREAYKVRIKKKRACEKAYREAHKDSIRTKKREWNESHKDLHRLYSKKYRESHRAKCTDAFNKWQKKVRKGPKGDALREYQRKYWHSTVRGKDRMSIAVVLRRDLDPELCDRLKKEKKRGQLIRNLLREHYGLPLQGPRKRGGLRKEDGQGEEICPEARI